MKNFIGKYWNAMAGGAKIAAAKNTFKFITSIPEVIWETTLW